MNAANSAAAAAAAPPPFRPFPELLRENAQARPEQLAVRQGATRLSWGELDAQVDRIAAKLQSLGLQAREAIAISGANSVPYLLLFLGALRAGLAVAPLPTGTTVPQLEGMLRDSGARLLFADAQVPELAVDVPRIRMDRASGPGSLAGWLDGAPAQPEPVAIEAEWPFNIIYSSGTTGTPKGIVQSHGMRWLHVARGENYGYGPDTVAMVATSLCSNTTLVAVFPALAKGGCVVMTEGRFDPAGWLALAQEVRATHAMLVPVQYQRLMALPDFDRHDLSSFRMKFCTSAPFSAALKADVLARWPGGLVEYYGMTEGGGTCILEAHLYPHKLHTVGKPADGHDIRLVDEDGRVLPPGATGEVVGRSGTMMTGYHGQPAKTREAEWYDPEGNRFIRTGDVARFDEDGFLVLMDRRKDMVISGGFNIYPSDLEAVLRQHPAVRDAAVVGVPSAEWGESPVAYVVAAPDAPDPEALRAWANERLGKTQRLAGLRYIAELPRSDIGKVLKRALRDAWNA